MYDTSKLVLDCILIPQDTVIDAGIFDGALGIISALSALKVLNINGQLGKLRRPVEVFKIHNPVMVFLVKSFFRRALHCFTIVIMEFCISAVLRMSIST